MPWNVAISSLGARMFRATLLLCAFLWTGQAYAQWMTTVEDDLFSDKKIATMIGVGGVHWSIYAHCSDADGMKLSYIEKGDPSGITSPLMVGKIVLKPDTGQRWTSETRMYWHNDSYIGFDYANQADIPKIIEEIGAAKRTILVGLDLALDSPSTISLTASGSSKAARQFLAACGAD